jgi:hypothetical protein
MHAYKNEIWLLFCELILVFTLIIFKKFNLLARAFFFGVGLKLSFLPHFTLQTLLCQSASLARLISKNVLHVNHQTSPEIT